jgi:hypothetical protein
MVRGSLALAFVCSAAGVPVSALDITYLYQIEEHLKSVNSRLQCIEDALFHDPKSLDAQGILGIGDFREVIPQLLTAQGDCLQTVMQLCKDIAKKHEHVDVAVNTRQNELSVFLRRFNGTSPCFGDYLSRRQ